MWKKPSSFPVLTNSPSTKSNSNLAGIAKDVASGIVDEAVGNKIGKFIKESKVTRRVGVSVDDVGLVLSHYKNVEQLSKSLSKAKILGVIGTGLYAYDLYNDFTSYDNTWDTSKAVFCDSLGFWGAIGAGVLIAAIAPVSAPALAVAGASILVGAAIGWGASALKDAWVKKD